MSRERIGQAAEHIAQSAFDFLERSVGEIEKHPKYSVIHFATAVELLFKARLMSEHWSLVVEKSSEADIVRFLDGTSRTVSPRESVRRLKKVCGQNISNEAEEQFSKLAAHRNRMIHFFHEAGADGADPQTVQEVVREQCLCWFHLRSLLRQWSDQFQDYDEIVTRVDWRMQRNREFLRVKFDQIRDQIEADKAEGTVFSNCSGCGFDAAELIEQTDVLRDVTCRVCHLNRGYLEFTCPAQCGATVNVEADHGSDRSCSECGHEVTGEELDSVLSTEFVRHEDYRQMSCAYCTSMGCVVQHGDWFICLECLSHEEGIAECEWCNEMQIGAGDLEFSYHSGCEFCDGHAGWHRDD